MNDSSLIIKPLQAKSETPITPVEDSNKTTTETQTAAKQREEELNADYRDVRSIIICPIHNYSLYRQINMKIMGQRKETIGSCVRSSRTLSSNKDEVEKYFPNIIGLSPNNPDFINRVKQYLNNIQFVVTDDAVFNTTFLYEHKNDYNRIKALEDNINEKYERADKSNLDKLKQALEEKITALNSLESTKYKYGRPENFEHYLMYRHCLLYKDVAKDLSLINSDPSIRFYFKDEQKEKEKQFKVHQERNKAKTNYIEMIGDDKLFAAMLVQYCISQGISLTETLLKERVEKELLLDKFSNDYPDKFNKMFNDKNLGLKSFIENLIVRGELIRSEISQNITSIDGDFIGANMNEAVAYFNNPANADVRRAYENKLKYI